MILTLYDNFKHWSDSGSVYIISDTHFDDVDCKLMDPNWISPEEHIRKIKTKVHKPDTLIHLGDVGNPEWLNELKCYKVLIMGNHDESASNFKAYFDEIYTGPLFIASKILLSHEPINGLNWCLNIHGHDHANSTRNRLSVNLASNVVNYEVFNLGDAIKHGLLHDIDSIHRVTIDNAIRNGLYKKEYLQRRRDDV